MTSIRRDDLSRYLASNPGTAALRKVRQDLVSEGVPLDQINPKPARPAAADPADPSSELRARMQGYAGSLSYSVASIPKKLAEETSRYLGAAAGPDGTIEESTVRAKLGAKGATVFGLLVSEMKARGADASQSAPQSYPANMVGADDRTPPDAIKVPPEALAKRQSRGLTWLPDLNYVARIRQQLQERDDRRDPARRIAEHLGKPLESPKIPALEALREKAKAEKPFAGAKLLVLQHLYASTQSILDAAVEGGLKPGDVTVLGKPYSGSMQVAASLVDKGYNLVVPSLAQSEYTDHEAHMARVLGGQLDRIIAEAKSSDTPVLVLDDGGLVAKMVKMHHPNELSRFRFVEQTQRGANVIKELGGLEAPVVNVAESWAKKEFESPSIAHSVWKEVGATLSKLEKEGVELTKSVTIMGFGAIGSSVAKKFKAAGYDVHVYDPDPKRQKEAAASGYAVHTEKAKALEHGHVVVGASGREAISLGDFPSLPKNAVLFNAASANNELNTTNQLALQIMCGNPLTGTLRVGPKGIEVPRNLLKELDTSVLDESKNLWDMFQGKNVCLGKDVSATQIDRVVHTLEGQSLYFAQSGFVINLTDDNDPIPPEYIGLTRSLLFAALMQTAKEKGKGLVELDRKTQESIVDTTQKALAKSGQSLLNPQF